MLVHSNRHREPFPTGYEPQCAATVPKEVFGMLEQGDFRPLWVQRPSMSSGEITLSSPGLGAESPGEVSAWHHWIMRHDMGWLSTGKEEFRTDNPILKGRGAKAGKHLCLPPSCILDLHPTGYQFWRRSSCSVGTVLHSRIQCAHIQLLSLPPLLPVPHGYGILCLL